MNVATFLANEAALQPYPGACCRMVDKWLIERTGFSALVRFGRDFATVDDVKAWLAEPGSIAVAVNRVMRTVGHPKTKDPQAGDVGLVWDAKARLCMSIHSGAMWVSRDEAGLIGLPLASVWKAWRIPLLVDADLEDEEGAAPED